MVGGTSVAVWLNRLLQLTRRIFRSNRHASVIAPVTRPVKGPTIIFAVAPAGQGTSARRPVELRSMRRLLSTLITLIALTVNASCGGGAASDTALQRAITATRGAGSASVVLDVHTSLVTVQATGAVDFAHERSAMRSTTFGHAVEERVVGTTLYARGSEWPKWLATSLEADDLKNPTAALALLGRARGDQRFDRATIDGVRTTHYRTRVTIARRTATADVWIDDDHRVRRVRAPIPVADAGASIDATATLTFSRFGAAVTITAPPAAEVTTSAADLSGG